ncbi:hypothetical protein CK203_110748 [Vitis vinifera]|uniref:Uncharacterized protein n=1 Tax=Vitis vinifera TaxID=29760 RepID=A0A438CQG9_VITVI|nr:hypothetical protein CK203_110748 [Vitis vinifera]
MTVNRTVNRTNRPVQLNFFYTASKRRRFGGYIGCLKAWKLETLAASVLPPQQLPACPLSAPDVLRPRHPDGVHRQPLQAGNLRRWKSAKLLAVVNRVFVNCCTMGKLGKKARKFAKKNLQSVLKRKRKLKSMFKKKSSRGEQDAADDQLQDETNLLNGSPHGFKSYHGIMPTPHPCRCLWLSVHGEGLAMVGHTLHVSRGWLQVCLEALGSDPSQCSMWLLRTLTSQPHPFSKSIISHFGFDRSH